MKSKTFSVVVQKNINPYLYLQKIICWAKEDRLTKKWESQKKILARKRTERSNARQLNAIMHNDLNSCRGIFLKKVREGPSYICSACNRLLYRKTVTELKKGKYIIQHIFTGKESRDNKEYICNKCSSRDRSCVKLSITDYSLMKFPQNLNV